jgi:hypothetical protein
MANASSLAEVLQASPGKTNFTRLTRLLICGGTIVLRELFDSVIAPEDLANTLNDPSVLRRLKPMKKKRFLTLPQWQILFPSPRTDVKSKSFDIPLLFQLLREVCNLIPPLHEGWDNLPDSTDTSLEADLARIKYYRNTIYAHPRNGMEPSDDEFDDYWGEIKGALLRITQYYNADRCGEYESIIDTLRNAPLLGGGYPGE